MEYSGVWKWVGLAGNWLSRSLYIQFLWIMYTLMGGVVLGIMPATAATYAVIRKFLRGNENSSIYQTFKREYKTHFVKINGLGIIWLSSGLFLIYDLKLVKMNIGSPILYILLLLLIIFYILVLLFFFPTFVHYRLNTLTYLRQSFLLVLARPIESLGMLLVSFILTYLFIFFPFLLVFLGVPLIVEPLMRIAIFTFNKVDDK